MCARNRQEYQGLTSRDPNFNKIIMKRSYYNFNINYNNNFITIYNINNNIHLRKQILIMFRELDEQINFL